MWDACQYYMYITVAVTPCSDQFLLMWTSQYYHCKSSCIIEYRLLSSMWTRRVRVLSMCACYSIVNIQCMAMLCLGYYECAMRGGIMNVLHTLCNTRAIIMVWYYQCAPHCIIVVQRTLYYCGATRVALSWWCGIINVQHALYYCGARRIVLLSWCGIISLEAPYRC